MEVISNAGGRRACKKRIQDTHSGPRAGERVQDVKLDGARLTSRSPVAAAARESLWGEFSV